MNNDTAEVPGATVATLLPGKRETHFYTDAIGAITSLVKTSKLHSLSVYPT